MCAHVNLKNKAKSWNQFSSNLICIMNRTCYSTSKEEEEEAKWVREGKKEGGCLINTFLRLLLLQLHAPFVWFGWLSSFSTTTNKGCEGCCQLFLSCVSFIFYSSSSFSSSIDISCHVLWLCRLLQTLKRIAVAFSFLGKDKAIFSHLENSIL